MVEVKYRLKVPEELLPMRFGSPLRNPHYNWKSWVDYDDSNAQDLNREAEQAYAHEWNAKGRVELVSRAALKAGFGDNAQLVRDAAAKPAAYFISQKDGYVNVFFHGTGQGLDAVNVFNSLEENDKNRVFFNLLDPGKSELEKADAAMNELGVDYMIIHGTDMEIPDYIYGSQDLMVGVASMHHHAFIPWETYRNVLKDRGVIIVSDWHVNNLWTPEGVYAMLTNMDWENRGECLKAWEEAYGIDLSKYDASSLTQADIDMIRFWKGYHEILKEEGETENAIWPMEGHRSKEKYGDEMRQAGFRLWSHDVEKMLYAGLATNGKRIQTNPHQILSESELLMLTVAQRCD